MKKISGAGLGGVVGGATAVGADNDLLQIIGIIVAAISTLLPIVERVLAKRKDKLPLLLVLASAFALTGCAQFTTTQTDFSYEHGQPQRQITTRATARTLFASRSALANFKASQTDKSQNATVGALTQESQGTNTVNALNAVAEILKSVK